MATRHLLSAIAIAAFCATPAVSMEEGAFATPQDVKWGPGPASIPAGAEAAVLYGDPSKEGLFALRLKMPKGYAIAPHHHPKPEVVTVISGAFRLGMGETADHAKAQLFQPGGFIALEPGMIHYAATDEVTVIQLNSFGPWSLTYVDPADDPRTQ